MKKILMTGGCSAVVMTTAMLFAQVEKPKTINVVGLESDADNTTVKAPAELGVKPQTISLDADALAEKALTLRYTDEAAALIAERSYSVKFGARNMRRYIQRHVEDPIAEAVIADYHHSLTRIQLHVKDGELKVTCM